MQLDQPLQQAERPLFRDGSEKPIAARPVLASRFHFDRQTISSLCLLSNLPRGVEMSKPVTYAFATLALFAPATPLLAQNNQWNGFYAGIDAGLAHATPDWSGANIHQTAELTSSTGSSSTGDTFSFGAHTDPIHQNHATSGFGGGARLGFNHQLGNFLLGAEADATMLDLNGTVWVTQPAARYRLRSHASNLETVRARAGIAFGRSLLFATGGAAFTNLTHRITATDQSQVVVDAAGGSGISLVSSDLSATARRRIGWAVGGGGEFHLASNLSVALTILHVDLGSAHLADTEGPASIAATVRTRLLTAMLGINLRF
jgi:outer membrane immunogenic protein